VPRQGARLALEALEGRLLPSASPPLIDLSSLVVKPGSYDQTNILVEFRAGSTPAALPGTKLDRPLPLVSGLYEVGLAPGTTVTDALAAYRADSLVLRAEPDYLLGVSSVPNDPQFVNQWALRNTGQSGGTLGADVHATNAWDVSKGSTAVTVALMDTGLDYDHPDLYLNVWLNNAEIPLSRKANLIDVDGDGLITFRDLNDPRNQGPGKITDVNGDGRIDAGDILAPMVLNAQGQDTGQGGWAYAGNTLDGDTAHPNDFIGWNFASNTNDPMDGYGHGTHVAGILGAVGNNGVGVTGVEWVGQLMPVKFLDDTGNGTISNFILGLNYSVAHGAKISNNSWVGASNSQVLLSAIQAAQSKGQIFVAAAGNDSANNDVTPTYPAGFKLDNVVAVAATDANDNLASFSNYGPTSVQLAAPGVNILSTIRGGGYGLDTGTSMATPYVTGAMALVWGQHPNWNYKQVIAQVLSTVDKLPSLTGKVATGGRLDVAAALGWTATTPPPITTGSSVQVALGGAFNRVSMVADGTTFSGGVDNSGHALSATLLGNSVNWNGLVFNLGAANAPNAVVATGQTIGLPAGSYTGLSLLATSAFDSFTNIPLVVTYADGTTQTFLRSFSEWGSPHNFTGESTVSSMAYRDNSDGSRTTKATYVYGYTLTLDPTKQVKSITLPNLNKINVLAMTLTAPAKPVPNQVALGGAFNRVAMVADGTTFSGGVDNSGHALSATLLGSSVNWNGLVFNLGAANAPNAVAASGQTINLPTGAFSSLSLLATSAFDSFTNIPLVVTYADGTTQTFLRSFSEWGTPHNFAGESTVSSMAYRDNSDGSRTTKATYVYGYTLTLDPTKQVKSITLPNLNKINVLAMTLSP
jgi:subtilisin family serine protease